MNYIFNTEKLNALVSDFYTSTGIAVTLYDSSMTAVATSPVYSSCCKCIRTKKECVERCNESNFIHMREAEKSKRPVLYTCHAGLMETITPIFYDDTLIAYMQTGQFRDGEGVYSTAERLLRTERQYGFESGALLELYKELPLVTKTKLKALQHLMDVIIQSFWMDGLIRANRSMLSVKIEQYITENIEKKIHIEEICDKFFISKSTLYRLFRTEFETTVNDFILFKRLQHAKELLKNRRDLDISQVSDLCGFNDYNYFIRIFKKAFGVTPLQYKKKIAPPDSVS
ncbi:MAG: PocR ligand-binding domain-containing protein [Clostridia bacterium]|nr:PocR ligand-binding domain-containing protein [Clostridia bacterium]